MEERGANGRGRFPVAIGNSNKSLIASIYPFAPVTYGVCGERTPISLSPSLPLSVCLSVGARRPECVFIGFIRGSPLTTGAVRSLGRGKKCRRNTIHRRGKLLPLFFGSVSWVSRLDDGQNTYLRVLISLELSNFRWKPIAWRMFFLFF